MIRTSASSLPPPPPFDVGLRVAVVQGGPSSEAEVSRVSAAGVAGALARHGHDVTRLECDRALPARLLEASYDVVFPVVHGAIGEDGSLQGLFELLSLPYVGASVLASALANDKIAAKLVFRAAGLPVSDDLVLVRDAAEPARQAAAAVERLGTSVVVKPSTQGSALGVTLLPDLGGPADDALVDALERAFELDERVLVERFVRGREVTCGVIELAHLPEEAGRLAATALPPTEIRSKAAGWYDFKSRYGTGGSEHQCPAHLGDERTRRVQEVALAAHRALGVRDLSRADFVVSDLEVVLLEVNTMPGMTPTSLYPEAAGVFGLAFEVLCDRMVRNAVARGVRQINAPEPFPA